MRLITTRNTAEFLGHATRPHHPNNNNRKCSSSHKKATISGRLKKAVWIQYMGRVFEGRCYSCNKESIDVFNCHYGHVHAEASGGATIASNLRPICALCNQSCGQAHMMEFAIKNGFYSSRILREMPAGSCSTRDNPPLKRRKHCQ